jgi:large subunit ribosomal protein L1
MGKHSGRYVALAEKIDREHLYGPEEAATLVKQNATASFDETVEIALKLNIQKGRGDQTVRGTMVLPHGTGKVPRVAVFADGEAAQQAKDAGADRVGSDDLVSAIDEGWEDFDVLVAHPSMMQMVGRLGRKLGPRMPNKKAGNITDDVATAVSTLKAGKVEYRADRGGVVHLPVGKASFADEQLVENLHAVIEAIVAARPAGISGRFIQSASLSSTMGPGVKLDLRVLTGVK